MSHTTDDDIVRLRKAMSQVEQTLKCPICLSILRDPCSLRCCHFFCGECLTAASKRGSGNQCPLCKEKYVRRTIVKDPKIQALSKLYRRLHSQVFEALNMPQLSQPMDDFMQTPTPTPVPLPPPPPTPLVTSAVHDKTRSSSGEKIEDEKVDGASQPQELQLQQQQQQQQEEDVEMRDEEAQPPQDVVEQEDVIEEEEVEGDETLPLPQTPPPSALLPPLPSSVSSSSKRTKKRSRAAAKSSAPSSSRRSRKRRCMIVEGQQNNKSDSSGTGDDDEHQKDEEEEDVDVVVVSQVTQLTPNSIRCTACLQGPIDAEGDHDPVRQCVKCGVCVHVSCYGIVDDEGEFRCSPCLSGSSSRDVRCCVCPNTQDRAFKRTDDGRWCHVQCALWHAELVFAHADEREPVLMHALRPRDRRMLLKCRYCSKTGACLQCSAPGCYMPYHVPCAFRHGVQFELRNSMKDDDVYFHSFCPRHIPDSARVPSCNSDRKKRRKRKYAENCDEGDTRVLFSASKSLLLPNLNLSVSRLPQEQLSVVTTSMSALANVELVDDFDKSVTHVVTPRTDVAPVPRTVKVFCGLLTGKPVVSFEWIEECVRAGKVVDEQPYLVSDAARRALDKQTRAVFRGTTFIIDDVPGIPHQVLRRVIKLGKGVVRNSFDHTPPARPDTWFVITNNVETNMSEEAVQFCLRSGVRAAPPSWVFDCVMNLEVVPIDVSHM